MNDLLGGDSDGEEVKFTINKDYASNYTNWRQKEVYQKLKDKHERTHDVTSSTSSSEDDEDAKDFNRYQKGFFTALSFLKRKDPRIYNENIKFFPSPSNEDNNEINDQKQSKDKKNKPFVLRDYERQIILEREGKLSDDDEITEQNPRSSSPTYVEEQKALKDSFKHVLENSDAEDEGNDFGSLFKKKEKTEAELKREEEDYKEWLKGRKNELKDKSTESDLKGLRDFWNDPNLNSDEVFLRDYILNKRFLDSEDEDFEPEFNEVIHDEGGLENNISHENETEKFEHKYNFRFEEPDPDFIKRYPRSVESSLRRKDNRRKIKREEIKARKEAEMSVKREEIKQLKAMKRKEILDKIEKIKEITGNDDVEFQDEDFEEDFDPMKHDQKMKEMFNEDYYGVEESDKPEYPELDRELEIEDWENWQGKDDKQYNGYNGYNGEDSTEAPHCEDPNFNMDCDYDPNADLQEELMRVSKSKKKQRRKNKFAEALARKKPIFEPSNKKFEEYFDEYYQLDCEDIIGDLHCRFKYRKTTPNDYGLTVDEILRADVKELNKWCSLKKVVKHKPDHVEKYEVLTYKEKARNEALKRKILPSLYKSLPDNTEYENAEYDNNPEYENAEDTFEESKKKKKKKKKKYDDSLTSVITATPNNSRENENADLPSENTKKKYCVNQYNQQNNSPENNFQENGSVINQTKVKNKKKKQDSLSESQSGEKVVTECEEGAIESQNLNKKKKKKKRKHQDNENGEEQSSDNNKKQKLDKSDNSAFNSKPKLLKREEWLRHPNKRNKSDNYNKKNNKQFPETEIPISDSRLKAYGIHPKKFKNKLKYGNKPNLWK